MRIAYADPPYEGQAHMYGNREVNHERLIAALVARFDGWALSATQASLRRLLPICPSTVRVGAWVKSYVVTASGNWPRHAWEPVIFKPARAFGCGNGRRVSPIRNAVNPAALDWIKTAPHTNGFRGSKPPEFCTWLFDILAADLEDEFHDLFYGSGAVTRAWNQWRQIKAAGGPLFVKQDDAEGKRARAVRDER